MPANVTSMDYATAIAILTPKDPSLAPIAMKADTFFHEEEFLGELQPDMDRARLFMSNDGQTGQYVDRYAITGKRDITLIEGVLTDAMQSWALRNPQPMFDLSFSYQRNSQDASTVVTHMHYGCKTMNHPAKALSNDIVVIKFTIKYSSFAMLNAAGQPI